MEPSAPNCKTYGTFVVGQQEFCLAAHNIREVVEYPKNVVEFNEPHSHVVGLFSLRDNVVPIVDMRAKLGIQRDEETSGRIAIIDREGHLVGALFDATGEVMEVEGPAIRPIATSSHQPVKAVVHLPGSDRLIRVLDGSSFEGVPVIPSQEDLDPLTTESETSQFIIVRIGDVQLAIEMEHAFEVHKALPVRNSMPYFHNCIGAVTLREASVGVLDIRKTLGLAGTDAEAARQVFVHCNDAVVAFPVDEVVEVRSAGSNDIVSVPLLQAGDGGQAYTDVIRGEDGDVFVLDTPTLFAQCRVDSDCPMGIGKGLLVSREVQEDDTADTFYLTFDVGGRVLGLDTHQVREIREYPDALLVPPGARPELHGVVNVRGEIMAVVDVARRHGKAATVPTPASRVIIVEANGQAFGLLVDRLGEIIHGQDTEDYTAAVHLLQRGHTGEKVDDVNRALRLNDRHDREVLLLLDPAVIAQSPALSN